MQNKKILRVCLVFFLSIIFLVSIFLSFYFLGEKIVGTSESEYYVLNSSLSYDSIQAAETSQTDKSILYKTIVIIVSIVLAIIFIVIFVVVIIHQVKKNNNQKIEIEKAYHEYVRPLQPKVINIINKENKTMPVRSRIGFDSRQAMPLHKEVKKTTKIIRRTNNPSPEQSTSTIINNENNSEM